MNDKSNIILRIEELSKLSNGLKDKYVTSAMANLFIQELEMDLTKQKKSKFDVTRLGALARKPNIYGR